MFSADTPASAAALRRVQSARIASGGALADWSQVPSPTAAVVRAELGAVSRCRAGQALPPVALLSTAEDVRRAYPEPLASALLGSSGSGSNGGGGGAGAKDTEAGEGARKRARLQAQAAAAAAYAARMAATTTASGHHPEPAMLFDKGHEATDYLGRSFLEPPAASAQTAAAAVERPCQPPRSLRGGFRAPLLSSPSQQQQQQPSSSNSGSSASGIQLVRWAPRQYGHLLYAANLLGEARLWETRGARRPVAAFHAHTQPIKSLEVTGSGEVMSTGSADGTAVLWDVEAGACRAVLTNPEGRPVVQHCHHPSDEDNLVLVAVDRVVALYDVRASHSKFQREYAGHMGTIFNLTLLSGGSKFLTTAEDRTLRTWDFRIPIQIKQFADANMHAITHVVHHPTEDFVAAQSLDNKVTVFKDEGAGKLTLARHREFTGHTTSGTRCRLAFSRDGQFLSSGDIEGGLFIWRWSSGETVRTFKAHAQMLTTHEWHPLEPSRIVTGAWDGHIKDWA